MANIGPKIIQDIVKPSPNKPTAKNRKLIIYLRVFLLVVFGIIIGFATENYNITRIRSSIGNSNNVNDITSAVNRHYSLPNDETPALATVTDTTKINSEFLKKSQNGDKILIYQTHQIAIIYRPSIDRIVAVGPVSIDAPPAIQTQ